MSNMSVPQLDLPKTTLENLLPLQWQRGFLVGLALAIFVFQGRLREKRRRNPRGLPLPPGPKGYPLLGSALDIPSQRPWLTYTKWRKDYGASTFLRLFHVDMVLIYILFSGDVVYAEALGKPMLILNSFSVIHELLEKRSSNFSHRPVFPVVELYVSRIP